MSSILKPVLGSQLQLGHRLAGGLVGLWLFNEGSGGQAFDLSGNGANGTITGMTWQPGNFGPCLHGVNATDRIALPSSYKPLDGGTEFTVIAYVKADSIDADGGIFYTDLHAGDDPALLYFDNATPDHFAACVNSTGGGTTVKYSAFVPVPGVYYHVAFVWSNGEGLVRLYINGVEDTGGGFPAAIAAGTLNATGTSYTWANDSDGGKPLIGNLDYGLLFNRTLSASEISLTLPRELFCMFEREPIELWSAATQGGEAPGTILPQITTAYMRLSA